MAIIIGSAAARHGYVTIKLMIIFYQGDCIIQTSFTLFLSFVPCRDCVSLAISPPPFFIRYIFCLPV